MIPFYLLTSSKTESILPVTKYFCKKYWPEDLEIGIIKNEGEIQDWSKNIYQHFLEYEKSPYVILSLDDFWPYSKLNERTFNRLLNYAKKTSKVGRIELGDWPKNHKYFMEVEDDIVWIDEHEKYKLSLQLAVWNREYILKYFWRDWSPWDVEILGSQMASFDGWKRVAVTSGPVIGWNDRTALSKIWEGKVNVTGMPAEDVAYLLSTNFCKPEDLVTNV